MCSGLVGADSKRLATCTTKHDSLLKPDPSACIYAAESDQATFCLTADETIFAEPSACIVTADEAFFAESSACLVTADETFCPDQTVFCRSTSCRSAHSFSSDQKTIAAGRPVIAVASSFDLCRDSI